MIIKKIAIAAIAVFTAVAVCQASRLVPASFGGVRDDDKETNTQEKDSTETEDAETVSWEELEPGDTLSFSLEDDFPETIKGLEVLSDFLPEDVELEWTGKKLKAPKAGKIKYSKEDEEFIDKKESDNPSGLSVKYNKKKGTVSGSFTVYTVKNEKKLKKYKAKFSGKAGQSMPVYVNKRQVSTAVIE